MGELEPVLAQRQAAQERRGERERVDGRADVVTESGQRELGAAQAAADRRPRPRARAPSGLPGRARSQPPGRSGPSRRRSHPSGQPSRNARMPSRQAASMSAPGGKRLASSSSAMPWAKAQAARARSVILAGGPIDGAGPRAPRRRGEQVAPQLLVGHQAVEVGVGEGEAPVGRAERCERVVASLDGSLERLGLLLEGGRDDRRLERRLVGEVLVERRRADPEALGDAAHRERIQALVLEDLARRRDDLAGAWREAVRSAGSHRACASRSRRSGRRRCGAPRRVRRSGRRAGSTIAASASTAGPQ